MDFIEEMNLYRRIEELEKGLAVNNFLIETLRKKIISLEELIEKKVRATFNTMAVK